MLQHPRLGLLLRTLCKTHKSNLKLSTSTIKFTDSKLTTTDDSKKEPIKFTLSDAYVDYKASHNFMGGDYRELPESHNYVLVATGIFGFFYLIFLRDDIEGDGGVNLFKPVHESVPEMAIPLLQAAIAENRKMGYNTAKIEKRLAELMEKPEKHGMSRPKLVEN